MHVRNATYVCLYRADVCVCLYRADVCVCLYRADACMYIMLRMCVYTELMYACT